MKKPTSPIKEPTSPIRRVWIVEELDCRPCIIVVYVDVGVNLTSKFLGGGVC